MSLQFTYLKTIPLIKQRTPEWEHKKSKILSASNCAEVLGMNPFEGSTKNNNAIAFGIENEPIAINAYEKEFNRKVHEFGLIIHPKYSWLGASPDGICEDGRMVEIKCRYSRKITNRAPEHEWVQCQIQMEVCDLDECDLYQYTPTFTHCITIRRNREWFANVLPNLEKHAHAMMNGGGRKRKMAVIPLTRQSKRLRHINSPVMMNELRNYAMRDKIIDWFNYFSQKEDKDPICPFNASIAEMSIKFTAKKIDELKQQYDNWYMPYDKRDTLRAKHDLVINAQLDCGIVEAIVKEVPYIFTYSTLRTCGDGKKLKSSDANRFLLLKAVIIANELKCDCVKIVGRKNTEFVVHIDEELQTKYNKIIKGGTEWVRQLKSGKKIQMPQPNMKNNNSYPWNNLKRQVAISTKELTLMWNIGRYEKKLLIANGITRWDRIDPTLLTHFSNEKQYTIQEIMHANLYKREGYQFRQFPKKHNNISTFYIDFESISNVFDDSLDAPIIKLIGIGHVLDDGRWTYRCLMAYDNSQNAQKLLINEFMEYIKRESKQMHPILYHWSSYEPNLFKKMLNELDVKEETRDIQRWLSNWQDLCEICRMIPVTIKGAFSFSLKEIGNAMYNQGLIETTWPDESINGASATYHLWKDEDVEKVVEYNEIDCKVMHDIERLIHKQDMPYQA